MLEGIKRNAKMSGVGDGEQRKWSGRPQPVLAKVPLVLKRES